MRLKLKMVYLFLWYFLKLKLVKMGYYGNRVFIFAWDLGANFLGIPNWVIGWFLNFIFFNFGLKGVMER